MLSLKFKIEHFIILVLVALLLLDSCGNKAGKPTTEKKTTIEEEIITKEDSSRNTEIKNIEPEKINVIERGDSIQRVADPKRLSQEDQQKIKQVNRYQDTTYFEGSRIFSDILSEGRILEKNIVVEVDHLRTTITNETTITKEISGLFFSPAVSYSPSSGVETIEANFNYIHKGSFGIGAGAYYNTITNHSGIKITIHKKIW